MIGDVDAVLFEALGIALQQTVQAILAHDADVALAVERPSPVSRRNEQAWNALYGWALERRRDGGRPSVSVTPITLHVAGHPFLRLHPRSSPRGAFLVSFHNPLHWLLGSLLLTAVLDRPDTYAGHVGGLASTRRPSDRHLRLCNRELRGFDHRGPQV